MIRLHTSPLHVLVLNFFMSVSVIAAAQSNGAAPIVSADSLIESISLNHHSEEENISYLNQLYTDHLLDDPASSLTVATVLRQLAMEARDNDQLEESLLKNARAFYQLQVYDSCDRLLDEAMSVNVTTGNDTLLAGACSLKCSLAFYLGNHDEGIEYGKKAQALYISLGLEKEAALNDKETADLYREMGNFEQALTCTLRSLNYFKGINDSLNIANSYRVISSIFDLMKDTAAQIENLNNALQYLKGYEDNSLYLKVRKSMANHLRDMGKYDEALVIFNKILETNEKTGDQMAMSGTLISIGNTLMMEDSVSDALRAFRRAKTIYETLHLDKYICHTDHIIGDVYYATYQYDSAAYYLLKANEYAREIRYSSIYEASLNKLQLLYSETGQYDLAYQYLQQYTHYHDSISGEKVRLQIADLEKKYETAEQENRIITLQHRQDVQQYRYYVSIGLTFAVFIVLTLIIIFLNHKRKKDAIIARQKQVVHRKQKELAEAELEKQKIREEELNQDIAFKTKQLSTHALHMIQRNAMLQELKESLSGISTRGSEQPVQKEIQSLKLKISNALRSGKEWDLFKLYFENINTDFYQKLLAINPALTTYDQRLCALIRLNLTSREMASVLNVASNSIKSSRYRLKKKLNLDADSDLEEFIRRI